jgi:hypothetical protein
MTLSSLEPHRTIHHRVTATIEASYFNANALCSLSPLATPPTEVVVVRGTGTRDIYRGNRTQFSRTEERQRRRPEGCL